MHLLTAYLITDISRGVGGINWRAAGSIAHGVFPYPHAPTPFITGNFYCKKKNHLSVRQNQIGIVFLERLVIPAVRRGLGGIIHGRMQ